MLYVLIKRARNLRMQGYRYILSVLVITTALIVPFFNPLKLKPV
jgi:hypothetical protein